MDPASRTIWSTPGSPIAEPAAGVPAPLQDRTPPVRAFLLGFAVSFGLTPWVAEGLFARLGPHTRPEPPFAFLVAPPLPLVLAFAALALLRLGHLCADGRSSSRVRLRDGVLAGLIGGSGPALAAATWGINVTVEAILEYGATFQPPIDHISELARQLGDLGQAMFAATFVGLLASALLGGIGALLSRAPRDLRRVDAWTLWLGLGAMTPTAAFYAVACLAALVTLPNSLMTADIDPGAARHGVMSTVGLLVWQLGWILVTGIGLLGFGVALLRASPLAGTARVSLPPLERGSVAAGVALSWIVGSWLLGICNLYGVACALGPVSVLVPMQDQTPKYITIDAFGWFAYRVIVTAYFFRLEAPIFLALFLIARWYGRFRQRWLVAR